MFGDWPFHDKTDWYYSEAWPFHDKTDWYYVWGSTISWQHRLILCLRAWQHRLILCLGLLRFMTKQTDTMSEIWIFHDKTDWYYVWGLTISWQNRLILWWGLSISSQNRLILCLRFDHFMTKQTDTMSGAWPFYDITDSHYVWRLTISWKNRLILFWGLTISWQNRLILCLGLDHFMTTQTDTMSEASPFHDKTDWYYVWGLTISWQNRLILCLRLHHFMTKQTYTISGAWSSHDKTDWYYVSRPFHTKTNWYYV